MYKSRAQIQNELQKERMYGIGGLVICAICLVFICFSVFTSYTSFSTMIKQLWFLLLLFLCLFTGAMGIFLLFYRKKQDAIYKEVVKKSKLWISEAAYAEGTISQYLEDPSMREESRKLFDFKGFFITKDGTRVEFSDFVDLETSEILPETIDILYNQKNSASYLLNHAEEEMNNDFTSLEDELFYRFYNKLL